MTRVLFLVNGLGLGNATRCHAVIARLAEAGAEVHVASSGNGAWYLRDRPGVASLRELEALEYGASGGQLSVWRTVLRAGRHLATLWNNERTIAGLLRDLRPAVVVTDSVYSVLAVRRSGVPIVAVNNSDVVHATYHRHADRPRSVRAQFHVIEESDRRFHAAVAHTVVSPSLDPDLRRLGPPFRRVAPIVRPGLGPRPSVGAPRRVLVMLSGSVFGSPVRLTRALPGLRIDVVGRAAPEGAPPLAGVRWHGKLRDNLELLHAADLAVVNGGFSAVSELFCLRKPLVVLPVPNHAEQWANARTIAHLGVGRIGAEATLQADLEAALGQMEGYRAAYARLPQPADGAREAAEIVLEVARGRS